MHDALSTLLGSSARVKLLRLFLFNPKESYSQSEAASRARVPSSAARTELNTYLRTKLIRSRTGQKGGKRYMLNPQFLYLAAFQHLLLNLPTRGADIVRRLRSTGVIKLIMLSGIFADEYDARLDILIVGDKLSDTKIKSAIQKLEAELGKELRYVALTSEEFLYRMEVYDKLIRDVLDYPHIVALDRLHVVLK